MKQARGEFYRGSVGPHWNAFDVIGPYVLSHRSLRVEAQQHLVPATCCPPTCGDGIIIEVLGYKLQSWQFPESRFVHHPNIQIEELMAYESGNIGVVHCTGWTDGSSLQQLLVQLREPPQDSLGYWSFLGLHLLPQPCKLHFLNLNKRHSSS